MVLCLPGLTGIGIQIRQMLDRLIALGVLSHPGCYHFTHFMDRIPIAAYVDGVSGSKQGIDFPGKTCGTSHQVYQTLDIMEDRPTVMPGITLYKRTAPLKRIKGRIKISAAVFSFHEPRNWIEYIFIIIQLTGKYFFIITIPRCFC